MTLEQELNELKAIRDGAPSGASHYHDFHGELNFFKWIEVDNYLKWSKKSQSWLDGFRPTRFIHSLLSVNRQIELIEQLLKVQCEVEQIKSDVRESLEFLSQVPLHNDNDHVEHYVGMACNWLNKSLEQENE